MMVPELISSISTESAEETEAVGASLAHCLLPNGFVALSGDLGAGKTAFVRGIASVLVPGARVKSPTYTIVNEYTQNGVSLFHFDMYRITGEDDLDSIGFYEYLNRGICVVEWCDLIPYALPDGYYNVTIAKDDKNPSLRHITIQRILRQQ